MTSQLLPIPERGEAWHDLRARHVGASEVAGLYDLPDAPDYLMGRYALWMVKAGRMPRPEVDNPRTRAGLALEEAIALLSAEQEGWEVHPGRYASHPCGLGATLDRIIAAPGPNDGNVSGPGCLELKNVDFIQHRRKWTGGEPPMHILLQLQAQLLATGYTWGAVVALVGGNDLRVYRYGVRPKLVEDMERKVSGFWASIREGRVPNADASSSAWAAMAATTELDEKGDALDLRDDAEAAEHADAWLYHKAKAAEHAKQMDAAKHLLIQRIGSFPRAFGDGWSVGLSDVAAVPDRIIAADDIGTTIKGRKGSRQARIKEASE